MSLSSNDIVLVMAFREIEEANDAFEIWSATIESLKLSHKVELHVGKRLNEHYVALLVPRVRYSLGDAGERLLMAIIKGSDEAMKCWQRSDHVYIPYGQYTVQSDIERSKTIS